MGSSVAGGSYRRAPSLRGEPAGRTFVETPNSSHQIQNSEPELVAWAIERAMYPNVLHRLDRAFKAGGVAQLIREYAANPSGRFAALKAFETLYRIVFYGIWQTLDAALAGVWALGIARLAQKHRATTLGLVLLAVGAAAGAVAIARVSGVLPAA